jgi:hypothetical protein
MTEKYMSAQSGGASIAHLYVVSLLCKEKFQCLLSNRIRKRVVNGLPIFSAAAP